MQAVINLKARSPVLPRFPDYGIAVVESRHDQSFSMPPSCYDFFEVMRILDGRGFVVCGKKRYPLSKGDIIVVPAGCSYFLEDDAKTPMAVICLCVHPAVPFQDFCRSLFPLKFRVERNRMLSTVCANHLRTIFFEQTNPKRDSAAIVLAHTLLLLSRLGPGPKSRGKESEPHLRDVMVAARVREYVDDLESRFHETETLEEVASQLKISSRSLTTHFRAITGMSRQRYIEECRLRHACRLLEQTDQSVTAIAFACGFEDPSTFFRAFRQGRAMSPNQWRSKAAG